jgi:hypothetical protein
MKEIGQTRIPTVDIVFRMFLSSTGYGKPD